MKTDKHVPPLPPIGSFGHYNTVDLNELFVLRKINDNDKYINGAFTTLNAPEQDLHYSTGGLNHTACEWK